MSKLMDVRQVANEEKRDMLNRGTEYRKVTAVLTSTLVNDLVSSGLSKPPSRANLVRLIKLKYNVNDERAEDVAKSVKVHFSRVKDRERLADLYAQARKRLDDKNRVKRNGVLK